MKLKDRLRSQRRVCGLTQKELGDLIKTSEITLRRWESDKNSQVPDAINLCGLATALNTTVSYLIGETDDPTPVKANASVDASIHQNVNVGNNTVTYPPTPEEMESIKARTFVFGEKENPNNRITIIRNVSKDEMTNLLPWWLDTLARAYDTAKNGTPQDRADAAATVRMAADVLKRASEAQTGA